MSFSVNPPMPKKNKNFSPCLRQLFAHKLKEAFVNIHAGIRAEKWNSMMLKNYENLPNNAKNRYDIIVTTQTATNATITKVTNM